MVGTGTRKESKPFLAGPAARSCPLTTLREGGHRDLGSQRGGEGRNEEE